MARPDGSRVYGFRSLLPENDMGSCNETPQKPFGIGVEARVVS